MATSATKPGSLSVPPNTVERVVTGMLGMALIWVAVAAFIGENKAAGKALQSIAPKGK